jgi:hypothetical protein
VDRLARRLADPSVPEPVPGDRPATDGLCDCVEEQMAAGAGVPITLLWARELLALVEQRASTVPVEIPA